MLSRYIRSGLEGAINCILARTSHQRTTSTIRTKALLPECPLLGGSTVLIITPWEGGRDGGREGEREGGYEGGYEEGREALINGKLPS